MGCFASMENYVEECCEQGLEDGCPAWVLSSCNELDKIYGKCREWREEDDRLHTEIFELRDESGRLHEEANELRLETEFGWEWVPDSEVD